ncbi:MAG: glyoxalase [Alphaproteobacteria bacterium 16-39-46]|nr:MAG: glyoxalase [Alphaproteobacteria bacterium 16-39-46]OZA42239.1 MAG: glyoxalase [Alphaproteobacteria bacterium 17-39-52]HQS84560.1 VOC family protein [Alphaproteobacteria bacterium]HQS94354.1 VOC family protein [Alphaproteobacteria bacterium]
MKFGYTILYVKNVEETLSFYEKAFGLSRRFFHESGHYGEMSTGETTLAFASEDLSHENGLSFTPNHQKSLPAGFELAFVTSDVQISYEKAIEAGAVGIKTPFQKPWGQKVAYVRDLNGILIELCSPLENS